MPLRDVAGSGESASPEHIGPTAANVGVIPVLTVIVRVVWEAHWPAVGVKVYVVVAVLLRAGAQVPVMPLRDVTGSGESASPEHIGPTASNVGVIAVLTVIVREDVVAH